METMPGLGLVCGVDSHADTIMAAVCDPTGRLLGTGEFPVTAAGHRRLTGWLASFGTVRVAGVEGTASYGRATTDFLIGMGIEVMEVIRPNRQSRRRNGKSDPADALAAARAVISGEADAVPKSGQGRWKRSGYCRWPAPRRSKPAPRPPTSCVI